MLYYFAPPARTRWGEVARNSEGKEKEMVMETKTVRQFLERLAITRGSTEVDDTNMAVVLHRIGFPQAKVTGGIVYLQGQGTIDLPPTSINSMAVMLLATIKVAKAKS